MYIVYFTLFYMHEFVNLGGIFIYIKMLSGVSCTLSKGHPRGCNFRGYVLATIIYTLYTTSKVVLSCIRFEMCSLFSVHTYTFFVGHLLPSLLFKEFKVPLVIGQNIKEKETKGT